MSSEFERSFIIQTELGAASKNSQIISNHINSDSVLRSGFYFIVDTNTGFKRTLAKTSEEYFLHPIPIVPLKNFKSIEYYIVEEERQGLLFRFDEKGTKMWTLATRDAWEKSQRLALIVDNQLLYAPRVASTVTGGVAVFNRRDFTNQEVKEIKLALEKEKQ